MYVLRRIGLIGLILGALGAGCDRGSSGFDISENAVIGRVLQSQRCSDTAGLTFCPADQKTTATPGTPTATAGPGPTATPLPEPTPRVDTRLANGASIACTRAQAGEPCTLTVSFAGLGFPPRTVYRVAARLRAPDTVWNLAADPVSNPTVDPPGFDVEVALPVPADAVAPRAQFAVLAFVSGVAAPPASMPELSQSGADYAFITAELALEVVDLGPPPATRTPTPAMPTPSTPVPTPSAPTPPGPTATATAAPAGGPEITYFGVARADNFSLAPSEFDDVGRPIYIRPFGSSFSLIVEGRPGPSGRPLGRSAYAAQGGLPDLHLIVDRPLGDGSTRICDRIPPEIGGVPATVPFAFSDTAPVVDAVNDLGCRVDDGQGNPVARFPSEACTTDRSGEFSFVDATTTAQFCLFVASAWSFPAGDTIVAARLRDDAGNLGAVRELVLRNADSSSVPPTPHTPAPTRTALPSRTPTHSPTRATDTPAVSATPTPTGTPFTPGIGPAITHLGIARADDRPLVPIGADPSGRPIYAPRLGSGMSIIVEAAPAADRRRLGMSAYQPGGLPDLQLLLSRPLGDGSDTVCDAEPPLIGGVPGVDPPVFSDDSRVADAINDLGCRVDDGEGNPFARHSNLACTRNSAGEFVFLDGASTLQYCLPIAQAWSFPVGDTVVAARARDVDGRVSEVREIVVRVRR